jgi:hypothetical protein
MVSPGIHWREAFLMQTELVELLAFVALIAVAIWLSYRALRIRRKDDSL